MDTNGRNQLLQLSMVKFQNCNAERSWIEQELPSCSENGTESLVDHGRLAINLSALPQMPRRHTLVVLPGCTRPMHLR